MAALLTFGTFWSILLLVLLFFIATYFVAYYFVYLRQIKRWEKSNIPFLPPTFLIGHKYFLSTAKYSIMVPIDRLYKENSDKDLFGLFFGVMPMIMIRDRKLIQQVFSTNYRRTFATGFALPESEVEARQMINLTEDETTWKFSRNAMMPIFSLSWFQGPRFKIIKETIHELWQNVERLESDGFPMNVNKVMLNAVLNIISSNFGIDSHSRATKIGLRTIIEDFFQPSYSRLMIFYSLSLSPFLQKFDYFKFLPRKSCNIMSEILTHQFDQRDQMNIETDDFIDLLRSLRTKQESKSSFNKDSDSLLISEGLTTRQLTGFGLLLVLAGSDTILATLRSTIHSISLYPEYQRRVRREVHEAMKKHGVSEFTFEVVRSLSFTFQCLYEGIRLHTTVFLFRQCSEDFQIPGTNYILRKGDRVLLPMWSLSHDEMQFRDPYSFDPERYNCKDSHLTIPGTLLNFGIGPRKCPGYSHGMFVAAAILASLLYRYEIKPRSHLKLMDGTDLNPKAPNNSPRRDILVDLVRCKNEADV